MAQTDGTIQGLTGFAWESVGHAYQSPGEMQGIISREHYEPGAGPYLVGQLNQKFSIEAHGSMTLDEPLPAIAIVTAGFNELGDDPPEELIGLFSLYGQGAAFGLDKEIGGVFDLFGSTTGADDGILDQSFFGIQSNSFFGIQSANQLPPVVLTASGTVPAVGQLDLTFGFGPTPVDGLSFPVFEIEASGLGGHIGGVDQLVNGFMNLYGSTGIYGNTDPFFGFAMEGVGVADGLASLDKTFFGFSATGDVTGGGVGTLDVTTPPVTASGPSYEGVGIAGLRIPRITIAAAGENELFPPTVSYAVNVKVNAMTRYTHWPFRHVVRFRDQYVGVNAAGAFTIGGGDADGALFDFEFTLPKIDFGVTSVKRLVDFYMTTRRPTRVRLAANPDEHGDIITYMNADTSESDIHTQRAKMMKGPRGKYWTINVQGQLGDSFDLDNIELRAQVIHGRRLI